MAIAAVSKASSMFVKSREIWTTGFIRVKVYRPV
jgi:hypothetical protein